MRSPYTKSVSVCSGLFVRHNRWNNILSVNAVGPRKPMGSNILEEIWRRFLFVGFSPISSAALIMSIGLKRKQSDFVSQWMPSTFECSLTKFFARMPVTSQVRPSFAKTSSSALSTGTLVLQPPYTVLRPSPCGYNCVDCHRQRDK